MIDLIFFFFYKNDHKNNKEKHKNPKEKKWWTQFGQVTEEIEKANNHKIYSPSTQIQ